MNFSHLRVLTIEYLSTSQHLRAIQQIKPGDLNIEPGNNRLTVIADKINSQYEVIRNLYLNADVDIGQYKSALKQLNALFCNSKFIPCEALRQERIKKHIKMYLPNDYRFEVLNNIVNAK